MRNDFRFVAALLVAVVIGLTQSAAGASLLLEPDWSHLSSDESVDEYDAELEDAQQTQVAVVDAPEQGSGATKLADGAVGLEQAFVGPAALPTEETASITSDELPSDEAASNEKSADVVGPPRWGPIHMLGERIDPGESRRLSWNVSENFAGTTVSTPVIVIHGERPGPVLCLTAAVHGDELNGVEVVRRLIYSVKPSELSGTLVGVPIVNLFGFSRGSRYLPDRRDLNRFFPGNPGGSAASRIAFSLFREISAVCDMLVDFHTGSFERTNLPQLRADLSDDSVLEFTRHFGATAVLHTAGERGMLRRALSDRGKPAVTFEIGAPLRLEPEEIEQGVRAIETLMVRLGMTRGTRRIRSRPQPVFYESRWVRADMGGMLFSDIRLGDNVREGQRLGRVVDPFTNAYSEIVSPVRGRILGMALNQVVLPGYASYHIGVAALETEVISELDDADYEPVPEHDRLDDGQEALPDDDPEFERSAPRDGEREADLLEEVDTPH